MILDSKFSKAVDSFLSIQTEDSTLKTIFDKGVVFTLCDRTSTIDRKGHYFSSFNLPTTSSALSTGSTMSKLFPELQQLNVDRFIMVPFPASGYSESWDGRSLTMNFPQNGPAGSSQTSMSSVTIVSSTYTSDKILKYETNPLLGDNVVFLFCDAINIPFTGDTIDEIGTLTSHRTNTSWNPDTTNFLKRPSATSYQEVKRQLSLSGIGTDFRTNTRFAVNVGGLQYPDNLAYAKYDVPVGFALVDRGIAIITHTGLTSSFPFASGFTSVLNAQYVDDSTVASKTNIYFTGTTSTGSKAAQLSYEDLDTSFTTTAVCIAMPREFYISNNPTWPRSLALSNLNNQSGVVNFSDIYVSQVGMYNSLGQLIAMAVLDRPVLKTYTGLLTFVLEIDM